MEIADGGDGIPPPEGWKKTPEAGEDKPAKRKMKSPYQIEILEKTYASLCSFDFCALVCCFRCLFLGLDLSVGF